jgi:hypothetical protein
LICFHCDSYDECSIRKQIKEAIDKIRDSGCMVGMPEIYECTSCKQHQHEEWEGTWD